MPGVVVVNEEMSLQIGGTGFEILLAIAGASASLALLKCRRRVVSHFASVDAADAL